MSYVKLVKRSITMKRFLVYDSSIEDRTKKNRTTESQVNKPDSASVPQKASSFTNELGVKVYRSVKTQNGATIKQACGSVVDFSGDVVVNAANSKGIGGGGVDGAINDAGGQQLVDERRALPLINGVRIPVGEARMTNAFGSLRCRYVVHAVSADYNDMSVSEQEHDRNVMRAYRNALLCAKPEGVQSSSNAPLRSFGFSLLSAGVYCGSKALESVLDLGLQSIINTARPDQVVYMVAFTEEEHECLNRLFRKHFQGSYL